MRKYKHKTDNIFNGNSIKFAAETAGKYRGLV